MRVRKTSVYFSNNSRMMLYQLINEKDFLLNEEDLPVFVGSMIDDLCFIPDLCRVCTDTSKQIFLYKKPGYLMPEGIAIKDGSKILLIPRYLDIERRKIFAKDNIYVLSYEDAVKYKDAVMQFLIGCINKVHEQVNNCIDRVYKVGSKLTDPRDFKVLMENIVGG